MSKLLKTILKQLKELLIVLAIGLGISTVFKGFEMWATAKTLLDASLYSLIIGYGLWKGNAFTIWMIDELFPWSIRPKRTLLLSLIGSVITSGFIVFIVNRFVFLWIYEGSINDDARLLFIISIIQFFIALLITCFFLLGASFNSWLTAMLAEEKMKQEAAQLRYDVLKSNVNPHFFFNSLSVLSSLVDTDTQKAKEFIQQFANIYRYVLEQRNRELVTLSDEITFITYGFYVSLTSLTNSISTYQLT